MTRDEEEKLWQAALDTYSRDAAIAVIQQAFAERLAEVLRLFPEAHDVLTAQEMRDAKGNWRSLIDQQNNAIRQALAAKGDGRG